MSNYTGLTSKQEKEKELEQEKKYLQCFESYIALEKKLEETQAELLATQRLNFVRSKLRSLYTKLQAISAVLKEEIPAKVAESLQALDSYSLYRILAETTLTLYERLLDGAATEEEQSDEDDKSIHSDSELRAVSFLYLLIRFVESNHRFPRAKEQKMLFDGHFEQIDYLAKILAQSKVLSPIVRAAKRLQKRRNQRNSVGIGSDKEDEKHQSESTQ